MAAGDLLAQYRAAREQAIVVDLSILGRLRIRGKDAQDLLHRLTTNDIKGLHPGQGTVAVFVTAKGRILDLVTIYVLESGILTLTGEGRGPVVRDWIERYTFREEVTVEDLGAEYRTLGIFGLTAQVAVESLFGPGPAGHPRHHPASVSLAGADGVLARTCSFGGEGFLLTAPAADLAVLRDQIVGAANGVVPAGEECLEILRIEAGWPRQGVELTEEHNPWEARLNDAISLTKGCYVGQEVIARLNTYKKVSKQLVRLGLLGATAPARGTPLWHDGQPAGSLTSAARVPGEDRVVALGYVRDEDAIPGLSLAAGPEDRQIRAVVEGLAR